MTIGLTGGIGSGKSTVAKIFTVMGCHVLNSDEIAKQAYFLPEIKTQIVGLLGNDAYVNNHSLNKTFIADQLFKDVCMREKINAIIHPAVQQFFARYQRAHSTKVLVKETALLFEAGLSKEVDYTVVVTAPEDLRLARVMQRDTLNAEQVKARMMAQMPEDEKLALADFVIYNTNNTFLVPQVLQILLQIGMKT